MGYGIIRAGSTLPLQRVQSVCQLPSVLIPNLRKSSTQTRQKHPLKSIHWLFRSNIPGRRSSYIQLGTEIHKRNFFGMGEIIGVLTNPAETVRSLTESKRLLDEARQEITDSRERAQIRPKHTFSRLPGFFPRQAEVRAIERALEGEPSFTVLFGASSVGKTALLREVLTREQYHVLDFDLRIAGFADLASLYVSLSEQMEQYFQILASTMEGYQDFEKEAWSFKHDRISVERRVAETENATVKTSDIARLMELFQSSLLKYWEFDPVKADKQHKEDNASDRTRVHEPPSTKHTSSRWGATIRGHFPHRKDTSHDNVSTEKTSEANSRPPPPAKKMPVIFFDEAHKLPALIRSTETMKCILDSMLVLTKQDRLCHVIHATSDPFYQTWLRQLNVMQHCKIITIGDCSKGETRTFFRDRVLTRVPDRLQSGLDFEELYQAFGGKLAHWHDFITDYINSNGKLRVYQSSHFLQAYSLLNLHIIHSSQQACSTESEKADTSTIPPGVGPAGFKIYSPITHPRGPNTNDENTDGSDAEGYHSADFSAMQLLKVMSRLSQPRTSYLPYFALCRELGVRAVDGMIKGRVLDLRWTDTVTREGVEERRGHVGAIGSGTVVEGVRPLSVEEEGDMVAVSERELARMAAANSSSDEYLAAIEEENEFEEPEEELIVGPKLVPTTPIMRFAMREVVSEYEDGGSDSEYASLSDVDEY